MFLIRQAVAEDAPTLLKLAKMVHFVNLPADTDVIGAKIRRSRRSFSNQAASEREREFMFVLEDADTGNVVGTSSIIACVSWPERPLTYLQVRKREHFSEDLQAGAVHLTLQLGTDESGPTEIGGLILSPAFRGHKQKLGALLSLIRFHWIGLHREWFSDRIIAEMMGPLTPDSRNLFWEYFGRRFINLRFTEADRFSQQSKEFMTALLPRSEIYATLLPPEARQLIGRVGEETEPAKAMLEGLGFRHNGQVDPFDGGPYLEARVDEIPLVGVTHTATLAEPGDDFPFKGFVSAESAAGFRAAHSHYAEAGGTLMLPADTARLLDVAPGDTLGVTPLTGPVTAQRGDAEGERSAISSD